MCCGTEAGSYLRLIDSCITQLKAQGPSRTCNESKEEEDLAREAQENLPRVLEHSLEVVQLREQSSQFKNNYFAEM